jgi:hypothetical protein
VKEVDITEATHVKGPDGVIEKIIEKWGVDGRKLAAPSKGGFGVKTESGRSISMWEARRYYKED